MTYLLTVYPHVSYTVTRENGIRIVTHELRKNYTPQGKVKKTVGYNIKYAGTLVFPWKVRFFVRSVY